VFCGIVSSLLFISAFRYLGFGVLGTAICLFVILVGLQAEGYVLRFA
jgi:hypothetical protein